MEEVGRLNLDYYEQVIIYKSLTNESYLTQIIEHVKPEYFNDKNIKTEKVSEIAPNETFTFSIVDFLSPSSS